MAEEPSPPGTDGAGRRRLVTILLLVHWWAVLVYVLPARRASLEPLPDVVEAVLAPVLPPLVAVSEPLVRPYLDLTATRQAWTLFAPWPAAWANSVRVVPYFSTGGGGWLSDTVQVEGGAERPYPHLLRHRSYRILFNLGYLAWETSYRPYFAREMCATLRDGEGRRPEGVTLLATWTPIPVPWRPGAEGPVVHQRLGGYDCGVLQAPEGATPWREYGLPEALDTRGWPRTPLPDAHRARPGAQAGGEEGAR